MLHSGYRELSYIQINIQTQTNILTNRRIEFFKHTMRLHYVSYIHIHSYVLSAQVAILQVIWITFTARGRFLVWIAEGVEVVGEEMGEDRTKQMSNISYSRHWQNLDIFCPCFILYHQIKLLDYYSDLRETGRVEKTKVGRFMSGGRLGPGGKGWH